MIALPASQSIPYTVCIIVNGQTAIFCTCPRYVLYAFVCLLCNINAQSQETLLKMFDKEASCNSMNYSIISKSVVIVQNHFLLERLCHKLRKGRFPLVEVHILKITNYSDDTWWKTFQRNGNGKYCFQRGQQSGKNIDMDDREGRKE